jgi:hypothetical protein
MKQGKTDPRGSKNAHRGLERSHRSKRIKKKLKILSSQMISKMTSMCRARKYLSNDVKITSNNFFMQKL